MSTYEITPEQSEAFGPTHCAICGKEITGEAIVSGDGLTVWCLDWPKDNTQRGQS